MNWTTIREAVRVAVRDTTGLPDRDVFWEGSRQSTGWKSYAPAAGLPPCTAELRLRQVRTHAKDEERPEFTAPSTRTLAIVGSRRLTVQVKFVSQRQSDSAQAFAVEGLMRVRLRRKSIRDALQTAFLGLGPMGPALHADFVQDGRQMSACVTELALWARENDLDTTPGSADWIDSARASSTVESEVQADTGEVPED